VTQEVLWLSHGDSSGTQRKGTSVVGNRYQRAGEETEDRKDSVCAVVKCSAIVNCN
jgi:hypothetical protein